MPEIVTMRPPAGMRGATPCTIWRKAPIVIANVFSTWCGRTARSGRNAVAAALATKIPTGSSGSRSRAAAAAAERRHLCLDGGGRGGVAAVDERHVVAVACEPEHDRAADAARAAGDERERHCGPP